MSAGTVADIPDEKLLERAVRGARDHTAPSDHTGRAVRAGVPYLLGGQWPGLEPGYVVMSIEREAQMQNFKGYD